MSKLVFIAICGIGVMRAEDRKKTVAPQAAQRKTVPASQGGLKAYKDSAASEFRGPTAQELQSEAVAAQAAQAVAGNLPAAQVITNGDGSKTAVLGPESMSFAVMTKNPDGSLTMECVTGDRQAKTLLQPSKTASASTAKGHVHAQ